VTGYIKVVAVLTPSNRIRVTVKDTGIGIPDEKIPMLFEEYGMLEEHLHLNPTGCGLGLYISNLLAIELGDKPIRVKSQLDRGTKFRFSIPSIHSSNSNLSLNDMDECHELPTKHLSEHAHPLPQSIPMYPSYSPQPKKKLLIADDNEFNRLIITMLLDEMRINYEVATNGKEALDMLEHLSSIGQEFRLIILDIEMPILSGWEVSKQIRKRIEEGKLNSDVKILAYTGYTSPEDIARCYQNGMDGYIEKPIAREKFKSIVTCYMS
jgi:CheY-like chemotaxis protein